MKTLLILLTLLLSSESLRATPLLEVLTYQEAQAFNDIFGSGWQKLKVHIDDNNSYCGYFMPGTFDIYTWSEAKQGRRGLLFVLAHETTHFYQEYYLRKKFNLPEEYGIDDQGVQAARQVNRPVNYGREADMFAKLIWHNLSFITLNGLEIAAYRNYIEQFFGMKAKIR